MNYYLLFSFLFFLNTSGLSQFEIEWDYLFGNNINTKVQDLIVTADSNYLVLGNGNASNSFITYVSLLSSDGDVIWEKKFIDYQNNFAVSCIEVSDGFMIAGNKTFSDELGNQRDIRLVKLSKEGDLIWEQTYGDIGYDDAYQLIETSDGGYAIIGYISEPTPDTVYDAKKLVIKVDSKGDLQWSQKLLNSSEAVTGGIDIDHEGDFICYANYFNSTSLFVEIGLTKISKSGDILFERKIELPGTDCWVASIKSLPNHDLLLAGRCDDDAWIMRTDSIGDMIWNTFIGGLGRESINDISVTNEEHILAVGATTSDELGLNTDNKVALLVELDADGQVMWYKAHDTNLYNSVLEVAYSSPNSFVIGANANSNISVEKINLKPTSTFLPDPTSTLRLYPNPVSDRIAIEVEPQYLGSTYIICNNLGQVCASGSVPTTSLEIDVSHLARGSYTFKIAQKDQAVLSRFIKL